MRSYNTARPKVRSPRTALRAENRAIREKAVYRFSLDDCWTRTSDAANSITPPRT